VTRPSPVVDLGPLGLDGGGHVLLALALADAPPADAVMVTGTHPDLLPQLRAWCTANGHGFHAPGPDGAVAVVERGRHATARWHGAAPAGSAESGVVVERPPAEWGLAARGAWVEAGGPAPRFGLDRKIDLWADDAPRLYDRALAGQWDPAVAIPWTAPRPADPAVEHAVAQTMEYLVENEVAALVVPARILGQIHPHFAEIQHLLAAQVADEARHAHVFARRAHLSDASPTLSGAGGRASLQTLIDEPSFPVASFLLGVLGEGTFLALLGFLERNAPDECTAAIARLTRSDEARHVAFGVAHLERHCSLDPTLRSRLAAAVERRDAQLRPTAGLNQAVFDSLVVLAAGDLTPARIGAGWDAVQAMQRDMQEGRFARLARLGFSSGEAETLAALHTRNFM
jgi:hypothetical protein